MFRKIFVLFVLLLSCGCDPVESDSTSISSTYSYSNPFSVPISTAKEVKIDAYNVKNYFNIECTFYDFELKSEYYFKMLVSISSRKQFTIQGRITLSLAVYTETTVKEILSNGSRKVVYVYTYTSFTFEKDTTVTKTLSFQAPIMCQFEKNSISSVDYTLNAAGTIIL